MLDNPETSVLTFVESAVTDGEAKKSAGKIQAILRDNATLDSRYLVLRRQLCVALDFGNVFCRLTYFLEGDGTSWVVMLSRCLLLLNDSAAHG